MGAVPLDSVVTFNSSLSSPQSPLCPCWWRSQQGLNYDQRAPIPPGMATTVSPNHGTPTIMVYLNISRPALALGDIDFLTGLKKKAFKSGDVQGMQPWEGPTMYPQDDRDGHLDTVDQSC